MVWLQGARQAKRKTALVLDIIQGKTAVSEASRTYDLNPSEVEQWVDDGKKGMENALRTKALEVREQYELQLSDLQQAYGEAMLELRARQKPASLLGNEDARVRHQNADFAFLVKPLPCESTTYAHFCGSFVVATA